MRTPSVFSLESAWPLSIFLNVASFVFVASAEQTTTSRLVGANTRPDAPPGSRLGAT